MDLTDASLQSTIETFSKEQKRLFDELSKATKMQEERPLKAQLSAVETIVRALVKLRSVKRHMMETTA